MSALQSISTSSSEFNGLSEIRMLDIRSELGMFIAARTLSAFPLLLDEHALPDDRQKSLSAMTLRKTSEGVGFTQIFMM